MLPEKREYGGFHRCKLLVLVGEVHRIIEIERELGVIGESVSLARTPVFCGKVVRARHNLDEALGEAGLGRLEIVGELGFELGGDEEAVGAGAGAEQIIGVLDVDDGRAEFTELDGGDFD